MEFVHPIIAAFRHIDISKTLSTSELELCAKIMNLVSNTAILNAQINVYLKDEKETNSVILVAKLNSSKHLFITNNLGTFLINSYDPHILSLSRKYLIMNKIQSKYSSLTRMSVIKYAIIAKMIELYNFDEYTDVVNSKLTDEEFSNDICTILKSDITKINFKGWIYRFVNFHNNKLHERVINKIIGFIVFIIDKSNALFDLTSIDARSNSLESCKHDLEKLTDKYYETKDKLTSEITFQKTHSERLQSQLHESDKEIDKLKKKINDLKEEKDKLNDKLSNLLEEQKKSEKELKRKLCDERIDSIIEDLTESFKRNKLLEVKLISTRTDLEESRYSSENKTKEILSLKSKIRELENKLKLKKHTQVNDSDDSLSEKSKYTEGKYEESDDEIESLNKIDEEVEEGEIEEDEEQEETSEDKTKLSSTTTVKEENMDLSQTEVTKTEYSAMDIDKTSSIGTFNKSVDMNNKPNLETKSNNDDFIPLEEDISYLLSLEEQIKIEVKEDYKQISKSNDESLTKKRKT